MVLCYHAVSPTWNTPLSVTPEMLESQIRSLLRRGWRATTFAEAVLAPRWRKTLAITFDDAFASVRHLAMPILTGLEVSATVFAPTAFMAGAQPLAWPGIEEWRGTGDEPELQAMSWEDLGELIELGWQVGSHTCTHPHLTELADERLELELAQSRETCASRLGTTCETIAYPYGDVDQRVIAAAARLGYRAGAALSSRLDGHHPLRYPRLGLYHGDADWRFRLKVSRPMRELRASPLWPR
jgi:peptidoglycan/xylan/chitin deacetylase (PgdA/CDA1 family)